MASTPGTIDEYFDNRLQDMSRQSAASSQATLGLAGRKWMWPADLADSGPFGIVEISDAFSRDGLNDTYKQILNDDDNTVGAAASVKAQIDELGSLERAFRLRHMSPVRGFMMGAARRRGHGHPQGVFAAIRNNAVDLNQFGGEK